MLITDPLHRGGAQQHGPSSDARHSRVEGKRPHSRPVLIAGGTFLLRRSRTGDTHRSGIPLAVLSRHVTGRLRKESREPAFVINGPIARTQRAVRNELEIAEDSFGLYEAITSLPTRQFNVIVLRQSWAWTPAPSTTTAAKAASASAPR